MATTEAGRAELFGRLMTEDMALTIDETIGGLALIVLGILSLDGIASPLLNSIAVIVAGVALMLMSATLSKELAQAFSGAGSNAAVSELSGSLGAGVLAGITGVVLGILAILDVARPTLIAVALIVFGAAVMLDFIAMSWVRALKMERGEADQAARLALAAATTSDTASVLVGVGLVTLGIIALAGIVGEILVAAALLGFGAYLFLKGTAITGRVMTWNIS